MTNPALPAGGVGGATPTLLLKGVGAGAQPAWQPGQRVEAVVVRQLAATEYLLRVDGALYAADLPGQASPGARLPLLFLGAQGAPRFLLLPAGTASSASIQLSTTGRMLGNLLSGPTSTPLKDVRPLLAAPTTAARPIALALERTMQASGLSYESHVAAWVQGRRPLAALLTEPQGRLSSGQTPESTILAPHVASQPGAMPAGIDGGAARVDTSTATGPGQAAAQPHAAAAAPSANPTLPEPLVPVVQQQLAYLTQGVVQWQGVLWPGQNMEWKLQVEDEAAARPGESAERLWSSTLTLDLPSLGRVQAHLRLVGNGVQVHLSSPHSAARLAAAQADLQQGIASAGLRLEAFAVDAGMAP